MTTRLLRACGGKSHSWLTPTISWSKPSANRISVAEGSSETIRMDKMYHTQLQGKEKKLKRVRLSRLHTRPPLRPFRLGLSICKGNIVFGPAQIRPDRRSSL